MHKAYAARLSIMRATILLSMVAFLFGVLAVPAQRAFGMDIREWVVKKETKGDDDDDMVGGYKGAFLGVSWQTPQVNEVSAELPEKQATSELLRLSQVLRASFQGQIGFLIEWIRTVSIE
jgi:hypothetical protein